MSTPQNTAPALNPVKNTLKFGMLGVLALAPWGLSLLIDSWSGRFFARSAVLRRSDAEIYGLIDPVLPLVTGRVMIFLYVFCWALALGLAIRMIYRAWRTHPLSGKRRVVKWLDVLTRVASVAGFAVAGARYGLDGFYIYPPEGVTLLMSSFGGALGPVFLFAFPVVQVAAYAFALAAVIYAAFSSNSFRVFAGRALAGVAVMLSMFALLGVAAQYLDLGRYLDDIPGMSEKSEPRTLIVLADEPVALPLETSFNDCSVSDTYCQKIPSSSKNVDAVRAYIGGGRATGLRGAGYSLIALNSLRELDPAGALTAYVDALEVTGDVTQGLSAVTRLVFSPTTEPYRRALDELGDETRFDVKGRSALRLSKAYARFGDLARARYWFDRGMEDLGRLDERDLAYFTVPDKPPFCGGRIEGRLSVDGAPAAGIRVGLARRIIADKTAAVSQKYNRRISPIIDLQGITDGTATDADGRLVFEGLCAENYVLLLSLGHAGTGRYAVRGSPGTIRISEARPYMDVRSIEISSGAP